MEQNKSPLVRVCLRKGSAARLAHLLPQLSNADGPFSSVNSFYLIYVPFSGECRDNNVDIEQVSHDLTDIQEQAEKIIKKSTFKFQPTMFPNPKLGMLFSAVEALALDSEDTKDVVDALGKICAMAHLV